MSARNFFRGGTLDRCSGVKRSHVKSVDTFTAWKEPHLKSKIWSWYVTVCVWRVMCDVSCFSQRPKGVQFNFSLVTWSTKEYKVDWWLAFRDCKTEHVNEIHYWIKEELPPISRNEAHIIGDQITALDLLFKLLFVAHRNPHKTQQQKCRNSVQSAKKLHLPRHFYTFIMLCCRNMSGSMALYREYTPMYHLKSKPWHLL